MTTSTDVAREFISRRDRGDHPNGRCDRSGRGYPSDSERSACCGAIRGPSRSHPWSYMTHCRTVNHLATLRGVDATEARREVKRIEREELDNPGYQARDPGGDLWYKAVAIVEGRYVSIYDGQTVYVLGVEMHETPHADHAGGYYVYRTIESVLAAVLPVSAALLDAPRAILRCAVRGAYCVYGDKYAWSYLTPLEIVEVHHDETPE